MSEVLVEGQKLEELLNYFEGVEWATPQQGEYYELYEDKDGEVYILVAEGCVEDEVENVLLKRLTDAPEETTQELFQNILIVGVGTFVEDFTNISPDSIMSYTEWHKLLYVKEGDSIISSDGLKFVVAEMLGSSEDEDFIDEELEQESEAEKEGVAVPSKDFSLEDDEEEVLYYHLETQHIFLEVGEMSTSDGDDELVQAGVLLVPYVEEGEFDIADMILVENDELGRDYALFVEEDDEWEDDEMLGEQEQECASGEDEATTEMGNEAELIHKLDQMIDKLASDVVHELDALVESKVRQEFDRRFSCESSSSCSGA